MMAMHLVIMIIADILLMPDDMNQQYWLPDKTSKYGFAIFAASLISVLRCN